jgi:hypothetical protein
VSPSRRGAAGLLLLFGAAVILGVRLLAPQSAPPLYDSFSSPSPYIWLNPSPGQPGHPTSASQTLPYNGQDPGPISLATRENPPQAQLIVAAASLVVPAGAHSITATITPVEPPRVAPPNGVVGGNTYRFRIATDSGADVPLAPGHPATLVLRGPNGTVDATVDLYDGTAWTALTTNPVGGPDIFAANTTRLGDAALVGPPPPPPTNRFPWLPWIVGGAVLFNVVLVTLLLINANRRRGQTRR